MNEQHNNTIKKISLIKSIKYFILNDLCHKNKIYIIIFFNFEYTIIIIYIIAKMDAKITKAFTKHYLKKWWMHTFATFLKLVDAHTNII